MTTAVTNRAEQKTRAPGPRGLPLLGSVFPAWRNPIGFFVDARTEYGDVVRFKFGPYTYYLVTDPNVVKHVLVDNPKAYTKSRSYIGLKFALGEGLLTSEGAHWRKQRKLAQPAFHRDRLAGFAHAFARCTRDMLTRWHAEDGSRPFDFHREMMRLTFRIVGLTLFSADVDGDAKDVGKALDVAMHWANDYAEAFFPIHPRIPTPANRRFKKAKKTIDDVVFRLIAERRAAAKVTGDTGSDLLGMLMAATEAPEDGGATMSDLELRDEVITMILAGHETTANLLSWTVRLLCEHPEIEARVREEAVRVLGDRDPTLEDSKALEYTRLVLDEALRLYPPAWVFERQAIEADTLGGYPIEAGSIVGILPYVMHRHPEHWEKPDVFDPERFRPERAAGRPRYAYLPFGGGPRFCVGNNFALLEAQLLLAMIIRDQKITLDPTHPIVVDPVITLRPKTGIMVTRSRA